MVDKFDYLLTEDYFLEYFGEENSDIYDS
jgi:hypothetical protein